MQTMSTIQNILIIGATGGIGTTIAQSLANEGASLILHGRNKDELASLKEQLAPLCNQVTTYSKDLSDDQTIQELATTLSDAHEAFDWIIHTAGYIDTKESEHTPSYDNLVYSFKINTLAPIHITQTLQDKLTDKGGVITISSTAALWGNPGFPIYAATKGALNTYTQALAKQFEGSDKTAITICPGGTNTPMRERIASDADLQQSPEVIAEHIKQIIEHTSEYTNGNIVIINDGEATKHRI
jgi:3-oxoacyl-[acyl-carrier protein] reductase